MRNFWLMAAHEYGRMVRKRSFLLSAIGIPLLLILVMGGSIALQLSSQSDLPLGYIDNGDLLTADLPLPEESREIIAYDTAETAREALQRGDIVGYFVIPDGFPHSETPLDFYYETDYPGDNVVDDFNVLLRNHLAADLPPPAQEAVSDGIAFTLRAADGSRQMGPNDWINIVIPFAAAFFFFFAVMTSTGYLLQVVTDEKENRTIEIMITSMTPEQLIGGKAIGLLGVSLTQIAIWGTTVIVGLVIASRYFPFLQSAVLPVGYLLLVLAFFLPAFALIAGVMTAIGGAVTEVQQGQQIAGMLNLLFVSPFFFVAALLANPNGGLATFLTLFPTTSFLTVALRWAFSSIPVWQIIVSWLLLVATAVFTIWAAARIFRAGMLRYGNRLSLRGMVAALRRHPLGETNHA